MIWVRIDKPLDCLIVGAGPAGLTAAIYLARFHLRVLVVDAGKSRAALIPRTYNHAGYPGGIAGRALLVLMREQAAQFGARVQPALIERIERTGDMLAVFDHGQTWQARTVLLATGVMNTHPAVAPEIHDSALARGLLRYCPICDGYEVTDRRVGVIRTGSRGHGEAMFLRMYTRDVTLLSPDGQHELTHGEREELRAAGVSLIEGPCGQLRIEGDSMVAGSPSGDLAFDTIYPALGSVIRSELAVAMGAKASDDGCLEVDSHQRTTVAGVYAAGDVTKGLDQISHAMGEAGVAATTIRNDLAQAGPLLRG